MQRILFLRLRLLLTESCNRPSDAPVYVAGATHLAPGIILRLVGISDIISILGYRRLRVTSSSSLSFLFKLKYSSVRGLFSIRPLPQVFASYIIFVIMLKDSPWVIVNQTSSII